MAAGVAGRVDEAAIHRIAGVSPWAEQVRRTIRLVAAHHSNALVMGPSGTGKELIARAIHGCSPRTGKPFIPVDCAVTTGTLFASHMFGHVKGAFTGAMSATLGCFRAADGGTIFLDEIGEMELELQAKLLRALQQRCVVPVGSHQEIPVDVRVVAATNRDLAVEVAAGRFREDLFYRLNVVAIRTVALRERVEDIPVLAAAHLVALGKRYEVPTPALSHAAIEVLQRYPWPGNVRELENVLERAVMFSSGDEIDPDTLAELMAVDSRGPADGGRTDAAVFATGDVSPASGGDTPLARAARSGIVATTPVPGVFRVEPKVQRADGPTPAAGVSEWPTLADIERVHLERTLAATMNNKSQAAKLLGIDRSVLRRKLQRHGLDETAPPEP